MSGGLHTIASFIKIFRALFSPVYFDVDALDFQENGVLLDLIK